MKSFYTALGVSLIGLNVLAQNQPAQTKTDTVDSARSTQQAPIAQTSDAQKINSFNKASSIIGMAVQDSGGKNVGKVQDLVLDLENSRLSYAVIALGNNRLVPVPISALKPSESKDHLVLNMSPGLLAAAPSVTNDEWPAVGAFAVGAPAAAESGHASSKDK